MKHRTRIIILAAAAVTALCLWWHQHQLTQQEQGLRHELSQLKTLMASSPAASRATKGMAAKQGAEPPAAAEETFDPAKFVESLREIAPLLNANGGPRDDASRDELQQKALPILSQIAAAPPDLLKKAMDLLMASDFPEKTKLELMQPCLMRIADSDPGWAANQALKHRTGPNDGTLRSVMNTWARQNAGAALAWIDDASKRGILPEESGPNGKPYAEFLKEGVAAGRAVTDPKGTLENLQSMSPEGQRQAVVSMANTLKTTDERRQAMEKLNSDQVPLQSFVRAIGEQSGFTAGREALEGAKLSPQSHDLAAGAIASSGIGPNTKQHADWLIQTLKSTAPEPMQDFIRAWTQADFNAAATWLKDLPASANRDTAVGVFAEQVMLTEPPSAVDWAITISDPKQRTSALENVWNEWKSRAPGEAASYFQQKGLSIPNPAKPEPR